MKRASAIKPLTGLENNTFQPLRGLVFDCDGVLFQPKETNSAYDMYLRYATQPPMPGEEAAGQPASLLEEALEHAIPNDVRDEAKRVRDMTRYRDSFVYMMQPARHMVVFLQTMRKMGVRLALCTNRGDSVHDVLKHFDITKYFSPVVTIPHVQPKPSPQGLLEVARVWDASPRSIVFLGDSLVDQQAAAAAYMPFWSYGNPRLTAEVHVSSFKELNEIVPLMLM
jgi:phosphoglycolate phosphatase-like HAD superfamily hydrolase